MANTAAVVLVGSELLRGNLTDENTPFLRGELASLGVQISSLHTVRDDVAALGQLLDFLRLTATYVITVGGLGPTIDDVTMEAVARAARTELLTNEPDGPSDFARMSGSEFVKPTLRHVPRGAELIETDHGPVVRVGNIFSLPGLPRLVRARFPALRSYFDGSAISYRKIEVPTPQSMIARTLVKANAKFPAIVIGCYPSQGPEGETTLTFEGKDAADVEACQSWVSSQVPQIIADWRRASGDTSPPG